MVLGASPQLSCDNPEGHQKSIVLFKKSSEKGLFFKRNSTEGDLEGCCMRRQSKELFVIIHWLMKIPTSSSVSHN